VRRVSTASPSVVRAGDWSGYRAPAHCTSAGRALLLDHDRAALAARFGGDGLEPLGPGAPRDVGELHERVAVARATGFAAVVDEFEAGLAGVAAPVRDFRGRIVAAINVSAPTFRLVERLPDAGREVRAAADDLSARMGWDRSAQEAPDPPGGDRG
jgi:IclR family KDG regulon transcriptional repressor